MSSSAAAPKEPPLLDEEVDVFRWRAEQFRQLGFDEAEASDLAASAADLGQARYLLGSGCPPHLALAILLSWSGVPVRLLDLVHRGLDGAGPHVARGHFGTFGFGRTSTLTSRDARRSVSSSDLNEAARAASSMVAPGPWVFLKEPQQPTGGKPRMAAGVFAGD